MDNLATAIVDSAHLLGQVLIHLSSNQVGSDPASQTTAASTIASIVGNLASFLGQLSLDIAKLIH
jgi:hypothetical protein